MQHLDVGATAQLIIAVGGAVTILGAGMRWLLSALDKRVGAKLAPIEARVVRIGEEMTPNHGSSIKDKVNEIAVVVRENTQALDREHVESERRHEVNVRALHRHDNEMSTIRQAVLAIMLRKGEGDSPRLTELERRILEKLQAQEELAHDRRHGRWSDDPDDEYPTGLGGG